MFILYLVCHQRADIHGNHFFAYTAEGRDRQVHQQASVHVMGAVYIDRGKQYRHATRSCYAFGDVTLMEMYQTSVVQVSSCNNQRNLQFFQFLDFKLLFRKSMNSPNSNNPTLGITSLVRS